MADSDPEREEYSYYHGIFLVLSLALFAVSLTYQLRFPGYPYQALTWVSVAAAFLLPLNYLPTYYLLADRWKQQPITAASKKRAIVVAYVFYVACASLLTMWGGGGGSSASNLLLLTSTLSVYVAKESQTKWLVGILSVLCYVGVSVYHFNPSGSSMVVEIETPMLVDVGVVAFIVVVSAVTSREIENRKRATVTREEP